jgi:hypothetical protein
MAPAHPPIPSVQPRRPGLVSDLLRLGNRIRHSSLLSWPVVLAVSGILFLGFAKAGSGGTPQPAGDARPPTFRLQGAPARHAPVSPGGQPAPAPPAYSPTTPDRHLKPGAMSGSRSSRPWWEHQIP